MQILAEKNGDYSWVHRAEVTPGFLALTVAKFRDKYFPMDMNKYIESEVEYRTQRLVDSVNFHKEYYEKFSTDAIVHRWNNKTKRLRGGTDPTEEELKEVRSHTEEIKADIDGYCKRAYSEGLEEIQKWRELLEGKRTNITEEDQEILEGELTYYRDNLNSHRVNMLMRECSRQASVKDNRTILWSSEEDLDPVASRLDEIPIIEARERAMWESLGDEAFDAEATVGHAPRR